MPDSSAELVDAYRMARAGSSRRGEIALSRMSRLAPLLSDVQGAARYELEFHLDSQSRPLVTGRIRARLELICQRCLEPLVLDLDLDLRLGIVRSDEEAVALGDGREPVTLETGEVSISALVEDELILGLPAVPLHPSASCRSPVNAPAGDEGQGGGRFSDLGGALGMGKKPRE